MSLTVTQRQQIAQCVKEDFNVIKQTVFIHVEGPEKLWNRIRGTWLGTVVLALLFWACVYCMSVATNDPFMYFSF